jgi:acyl-CoA hydrolase
MLSRWSSRGMVVTEYGLVNLKGKSIPERAKAMISLARGPGQAC